MQSSKQPLCRGRNRLFSQCWSPSCGLPESFLLREMRSITEGPLPGGFSSSFTTHMPTHCQSRLIWSFPFSTKGPDTPISCCLFLTYTLSLLFSHFHQHFSSNSCFSELGIQRMTWSDMKAKGYSYYSPVLEPVNEEDGERQGQVPSMAQFNNNNNNGILCSLSSDCVCVCVCFRARTRVRERERKWERRPVASFNWSGRALVRCIVWWSPRFPPRTSTLCSPWLRSASLSDREDFPCRWTRAPLSVARHSGVHLAGQRGHTAALWITHTAEDSAVCQSASLIRVPRQPNSWTCYHE